jgi:hypothetical protein
MTGRFGRSLTKGQLVADIRRDLPGQSVPISGQLDDKLLTVSLKGSVIHSDGVSGPGVCLGRFFL